MAATQSWKWKEEPVSPAGFPDFDNEVDNTWGLFEDEEVQQQKSLSTATHKQDKHAEPTRAEIATKLLQDLDEWIKEGKNNIAIYRSVILYNCDIVVTTSYPKRFWFNS